MKSLGQQEGRQQRRNDYRACWGRQSAGDGFYLLTTASGGWHGGRARISNVLLRRTQKVADQESVALLCAEDCLL